MVTSHSIIRHGFFFFFLRMMTIKFFLEDQSVMVEIPWCKALSDRFYLMETLVSQMFFSFFKL